MAFYSQIIDYSLIFNLSIDKLRKIFGFRKKILIFNFFGNFKEKSIFASPYHFPRELTEWYFTDATLWPLSLVGDMGSAAGGLIICPLPAIVLHHASI
jgi:hypothetical protein